MLCFEDGSPEFSTAKGNGVVAFTNLAFLDTTVPLHPLGFAPSVHLCAVRHTSIPFLPCSHVRVPTVFARVQVYICAPLSASPLLSASVRGAHM